MMLMVARLSCERERERGKAERVSERDVAPSSAHSGLTRGASAGAGMPSGDRGLWPVGHCYCLIGRF